MKIEGYHVMGIFALIIVLMISLSNAQTTEDYQLHKIKKNYEFIVDSNNATSCNLTYIQYNSSNKNIFNLPMTKDNQTFYITILGSNYSSIGTVTHGVICTDGISKEGGSKTIQVTSTGNQGTSFYLISIIILAMFFLLLSVFAPEELFVYISGIFWLLGGIYVMINGIDILNIQDTRNIAYVFIGLGLLLTVGAYIMFNGYGFQRKEEDDY